eukprot:gene18069-19878_t
MGKRSREKKLMESVGKRRQMIQLDGVNRRSVISTDGNTGIQQSLKATKVSGIGLLGAYDEDSDDDSGCQSPFAGPVMAKASEPVREVKMEDELAGFLAEINAISEQPTSNTQQQQSQTKTTPVAEAYNPEAFDPYTQSHLLPEPWQAVHDESSGYHYYWNCETNEVQWIPPPALVKSDVPLPVAATTLPAATPTKVDSPAITATSSAASSETVTGNEEFKSVGKDSEEEQRKKDFSSKLAGLSKKERIKLLLEKNKISTDTMLSTADKKDGLRQEDALSTKKEALETLQRNSGLVVEDAAPMSASGGIDNRVSTLVAGYESDGSDAGQDQNEAGVCDVSCSVQKEASVQDSGVEKFADEVEEKSVSRNEEDGGSVEPGSVRDEDQASEIEEYIVKDSTDDFDCLEEFKLAAKHGLDAGMAEESNGKAAEEIFDESDVQENAKAAEVDGEGSAAQVRSVDIFAEEFGVGRDTRRGDGQSAEENSANEINEKDDAIESCVDGEDEPAEDHGVDDESHEGEEGRECEEKQRRRQRKEGSAHRKSRDKRKHKKKKDKKREESRRDGSRKNKKKHKERSDERLVTEEDRSSPSAEEEVEEGEILSVNEVSRKEEEVNKGLENDGECEVKREDEPVESMTLLTETERSEEEKKEDVERKEKEEVKAKEDVENEIHDFAQMLLEGALEDDPKEATAEVETGEDMEISENETDDEDSRPPLPLESRSDDTNLHQRSDSHDLQEEGDYSKYNDEDARLRIADTSRTIFDKLAFLEVTRKGLTNFQVILIETELGNTNDPCSTVKLQHNCQDILNLFAQGCYYRHVLFTSVIIELGSFGNDITDIIEEALSKARFKCSSTAHGKYKTRMNDWRKGALTSDYLLSKLDEVDAMICNYEETAAPSGWTCHWSREHGMYYYHNESTGESSWSYPASSSSATLPAQHTGPVYSPALNALGSLKPAMVNPLDSYGYARPDMMMWQTDLVANIPTQTVAPVSTVSNKGVAVPALPALPSADERPPEPIPPPPGEEDEDSMPNPWDDGGRSGSSSPVHLGLVAPALPAGKIFASQPQVIGAEVTASFLGNAALSSVVAETTQVLPSPASTQDIASVLIAKAEKKKKTKRKALTASGMPSKKLKGVSSLVQKWQKVKQKVELEMQETDSEDEDAGVVAQKRIEEWRKSQLQSGKAAYNPNFEEIKGDWRERLKKK